MKNVLQDTVSKQIIAMQTKFAGLTMTLGHQTTCTQLTSPSERHLAALDRTAAHLGSAGLKQPKYPPNSCTLDHPNTNSSTL